jgi:hypothetical protein
MKKIIFALVVLMLTAPAWAEVLITCQQAAPNDPNVIVSYANTETQSVRGIALNIVVDKGKILEVECLSSAFGYYIYPGSVDIEGGQEPTGEGWGTCVCDADKYDDTLPGPPDSNGVTIEMASLYSPNDPDHNTAPDDVGNLVRIKVETNCCITIAKNVLRAGVVMEDATSVEPNSPGCCVTGIDPNEGTCWDPYECQGQPLGDATCDGSINFADLGPVKISFFKSYPDPNYNCCADFNRDRTVNFADLGPIKVNFFTSGYTFTGNTTCPTFP